MSDSAQTNEIKTGFLDYAGLSKFWELVKAKVAAELSVATGDNGIEIKLKDVDGKSLGNGGTIPIASASNAGLMSASQASQLEKIDGAIASALTLDGIKVKGTEATIADKKINIDLQYDKTNKSIKIVDLNNNSAVLTSISATDFIANGIFKDAKFIENSQTHVIYLQLTFTMPDGKDNTIEIQVSDLITKYEAGNGISITKGPGNDDINDTLINSGTITLNIKNNEKYIKCGTDGVYTDGIDTAITNAKNEALNTALAADKTTEDIQIAGGPLANNIEEGSEDEKEEWPWTDNAGNKVIPKGKSLEEILTALFLKVINGTVTKSVPVWNPSLAKPSITIVSNTNTDTAVSGTFEVGTKVAAKVVTSNTVTGNTRTQTFTCDQGYFIGTGTTWNQGNYEASKTGSIGTISADNKASISSMTWNNDAKTGTTTTANNIDTVIVKDLTVKEGTNTFAATQSGLTASVSKFDNGGTTNIYASTNTKKKLTDKFETIDNTDPADIDLSSNNSATITGKRYMFCGALASAPQSLDSNTIRNATNQYGKAIAVGTVTPKPNVTDNTFYISFPPVGSGVKYFYIAIPANSNLKLSKVYDSTLGAEFGEIKPFLSNIETVNDVKGANNYTGISYTVYTFTSGTAYENASDKAAGFMITIENKK